MSRIDRAGSILQLLSRSVIPSEAWSEAECGVEGPPGRDNTSVKLNMIFEPTRCLSPPGGPSTPCYAALRTSLGMT
jgi:hypothetical protein